jgi:hypothetical protein
MRSEGAAAARTADACRVGACEMTGPQLPGAPHLAWRDDRLALEGHALDALADRFGTPLYVYSRASMRAALAAYAGALHGRAHLICYAMKANSSASGPTRCAARWRWA